MAFSFDVDSVGAVLEYFLLFRGNNPFSASPERRAWETANILRERGQHVPHAIAANQVWLGPAVSERQLLGLLETGRDPNQTRRRLDRIFLKLETLHLIDPFTEDYNLATPYRVLSTLGEELLRQDAHQEYIFGLQRVVARWKDSVVKIYHPREKGIGTGYLVDPGIIATARHVVEDLGDFEVAFDDGTVVQVSSVEYPQRDEQLDLAIVKLREPVKDRKPFRLSSNRELLDEVVVFGFPPVPNTDDAYLVVNRGELSAEVRLYTGFQALVVSCLLRGGNSGGPVVNRRGQVIGTVSINLYERLSNRIGDAQPATEEAPDDAGPQNEHSQETTEESINEGLGFAAAVPSEWLEDLLHGRV